MSTDEFDLDHFLASESETYKREQEVVNDGTHVYFNESDYYLHFVDEKGVTIWSECCADTLDFESAVILRDRLNRWIEAKS